MSVDCGGSLVETQHLPDAFGWNSEHIGVPARRRAESGSAGRSVGRSKSWLWQVEGGIRLVDRLSVLLDMAKILHVDVESLLGRPWQLAPNGERLPRGLDAVQQVVIHGDLAIALRGRDGCPDQMARASSDDQVGSTSLPVADRVHYGPGGHKIGHEPWSDAASHAYDRASWLLFAQVVPLCFRL